MKFLKPILIIWLLLFNNTIVLSQWTQIGNSIEGESDGDESGSVSLGEGNIVAIGSHLNDKYGLNAGYLRVFNYNYSKSLWSQIGENIHGKSTVRNLARAVNISDNGNIVLVDGKSGQTSMTRVFIFDSTTFSWSQMGQDIGGENAGDNFGNSVDLSDDGSTIAIGSSNNSDNGSYSGHVRIYKYDIGISSWVQIGQDINGANNHDMFGSSICLNEDGNTIVIGATGNHDNGTNAGQVRIFTYNSTSLSWNQVGQNINGERAFDNSGYSVSINDVGDIVAIGSAWNDDNGVDAGHVRVYKLDSNTSLWSQIGQDIDGENAGDNSGNSLSLSSSGNIIAIGSPLNNDNGINAGQVRIYEFTDSASIWSQIGDDINGPTSNSYYGLSLSLNNAGNTIAIGGGVRNSCGIETGFARIYKYCSNISTAKIKLIKCGSYVVPSGLRTYTQAGIYRIVDTIINYEGCDSIITIDLTLKKPSSSTDIHIVCDSYKWIDGVTYSSSNFTATKTLTNSQGCDSIVALNLTINRVKNSTVSLNGTAITANYDSATYQWLNCSNNSVISGATNQTYTFTNSGRYACIITFNECTDTTDCINTASLEIANSALADGINIFLNSNNNSLKIFSNEIISDIEILDINLRRIVVKNKIGSQDESIDIGLLPNSLYFVRVITQNGLVSYKKFNLFR